MTPRERPNDPAIAASATALRCLRSRTDRVNPRPDNATMAAADVHSRSPVTAAGGICPNSLSASPAPNCTETIPVRIMAAGSAIPERARRDWTGRSWPGPRSVRTESLSPT